MSLKNRIDRLEEEAGPKRCDNCREWPDRIITRGEPGKDPHYAGVTERCERCGFAPLWIVIVIRRSKEAGRM
jgi:hypothetical protein